MTPPRTRSRRATFRSARHRPLTLTLAVTLAAVLLTARSAPSSAQAPTAGAGEPATSSEQSQRYVVQPGDACERVAARVYGDARQCYTLIVPANPSIAPNPNVLTPGSVLTLPGVTPSLIATDRPGALWMRPRPF